MRKNGLDIELRKSILKYLEAGHGYKKIATDFGISVYTAKYIRDIYRRGDLSYFDGIDKATQHDASEKLAIVQQFFDSILPLKSFAREAGINPNTLRNWVLEYCEEPQHCFDGNHKRLRIKACEKDALVKQFLHSGLSLKAFAQKSGFKPDTIKSWVQTYCGEARQTCDGVSKKTRREDSEKLALVDAFLASGLPLTAFAKSEGINPSTFRTWVRKYQEGTLLKKS